jgi:polyisoprenoid-binding protein YceI
LIRAHLSVACLASALALAAPADAEELSLDAAASTLGFQLGHALHKVHGTLRPGALEGRAAIDRTSHAARAELRARVDAFSTGNVNRDAHMFEVIEAARFPLVELKAIAPDAAPPAALPATVEGRVQCRLSFHGVTEDLVVPARYEWSQDRVRVRVRFQISLEKHQVKRPSLMFVVVDDPLTIEADLVFSASSRR